MNVVIFIAHHTRLPRYLALCQCGTRHGPYAKVAQIPPQCCACEQKGLSNESRESGSAMTLRGPYGCP
jgi:hypothetical protein